MYRIPSVCQQVLRAYLFYCYSAVGSRPFYTRIRPVLVYIHVKLFTGTLFNVKIPNGGLSFAVRFCFEGVRVTRRLTLGSKSRI